MKKELPKAYAPEAHEDKIYKKWEKSGYFNPDNLDLPKGAKPYTIILPPPNITAKLHMGGAMMLVIEDLLIRYHRMKGYRTLWLPGTDHAAIATQNVVEKKIFKEEGLTRHDLGREKLLERIWKFLRETQSTILRQARKMGASLDWGRVAFTLDAQRVKAVKKMFVDMYKAGVIYRGERIVNWCPRCQSTLADDEVEYKEQDTKLYTFKYSKDFPFAIATTRPETKLGDTAVAVNLKDERYKKYVGKIYEVDFCGVPLKLKIITDNNVDMEFGTGALGVTPAHSMADSQMAFKNNLDIVKVIDESGKIHEGFDKYSGKSVLEAREIIIYELKKKKLLKKEDDVKNNLSVCYRCNTAIEPLPSKQWFVAVDKKIKKLGGKSLKEKAIEVAEKDKIKFTPSRFKKRYLDWMHNLHDWCVSRQIWFGHRIPVWYCRGNDKKQCLRECHKPIVSMDAPAKCPVCGSKDLIQDEDSLDTWFSSGMWTFSTLGWPDAFKNGKKSGDLAKFHPTQVLETGYEILTLWVSRMIMMSLFAVGEIPFENVYLHGMVLDKHGKKMSKSKGNGIDPIDVIEKFGTDAVRLSLLIGNTPGNDLRLSEEKIAGYRNFANKLWNIARYVISDLTRLPARQGFQISDLSFDDKKLTLTDKWILGKLNDLIQNVSNDLDGYRFSQAGERLKEFTWNYLADWYLEASKFEKHEDKNKILLYALETVLKLWHPFMPFVTEVLWQEIFGKDKMLMIEKWPVEAKFKILADVNRENFDLIMDIIKSIRNARAENKVEPSKKVKAVIYAGKQLELIKSQEVLIKSMRTGIKELVVEKSGKKIKGAIYTTASGVEIYLIGAVDKEKEQARIKKEIENLEKLIKSATIKIENKEFIDKAPKEIVDKEKVKLKDWQEQLKKLRNK